MAFNPRLAEAHRAQNAGWMTAVKRHAGDEDSAQFYASLRTLRKWLARERRQQALFESDKRRRFTSMLKQLGIYPGTVSYYMMRCAIVERSTNQVDTLLEFDYLVRLGWAGFDLL